MLPLFHSYAVCMRHYFISWGVGVHLLINHFPQFSCSLQIPFFIVCKNGLLTHFTLKALVFFVVFFLVDKKYR